MPHQDRLDASYDLLAQLHVSETVLRQFVAEDGTATENDALTVLDELRRRADLAWRAFTAD